MEEGENEPEGAIGDILDEFFGGWTEAEAKTFEDAVAVFEQIDAAIWQ